MKTTLGIALTSNTRLVAVPGNVLLPTSKTGLPPDSVANVTQLVTLDESYLAERAGRIPRNAHGTSRRWTEVGVGPVERRLSA